MGSYSSITDALIERLKHHAGKNGSILDKFNVSDVPVLEIESNESLPSLRLYVPDISEQFTPGALNKTALVVKFTVSTAHGEGVLAHMKAVEKALDALEVNKQGKVDAMLEGTIRKPFSVKSSDAFVSSIAITSQLSITFVPRKTPQRGKRRNL